MSQPDSVAGTWRKSTRCESQKCVEVAEVTAGMAVRNSTDPERHVVFPATAWQAFVDTVRLGEFDRG
ncbi:uncharacterized protein DUF397 [Micromonospora pisi]|uniref:Uncharacterized protein DUF397 n=1 Tax=Micromonospora pisi TaxID=589240 RepID=A0A495JI30_9ACTN|nr:DUF397 domain-containing protein [Micromonospora pisi]RKR87982.1 uncharacterized protein DUF397 [Micromonospora pisi]